MIERESSLAGFTLFELLLVLSIIAVAMAVVLPSLSAGLSSLLLKSAALDISAEISKARERALRERRVYYIEAAEGALLVRAAEGKTSSKPVSDELKLEGSQPITFYPDGISTGGKMTLKNGDGGFAIFVLANGRTKVETIE